MPKKPAYMAQWIWDEYLACRNDFVERSEDRAIIDKCIASEDCATVWKAIDRYRNKRPSSLVLLSPHRTSATASILHYITDIVRGSPQNTRIPAKIRRKLGISVSTEIMKLIETIYFTPRQHPDGEYVPRLAISDDPAFQSSWSDMSRRYVAEISKGSPFIRYADILYACDPAMFETAYARGAESALADIRALLLRIGAALRLWGESKPPVTKKPGSGYGRRAYFIIQMTRFLREEYGVPMRPQVTAIVKAVFGTEISVAAIRKLTRTK